uniref:Uncharacterized protein n=1 Tax=Setaria viridis TaxID=4556 RepID=A0A4U6U4A3_SETVI|nr:hypothetical protein SEVIR_6G163500v2 [Setaria viridis]
MKRRLGRGQKAPAFFRRSQARARPPRRYPSSAQLATAKAPTRAPRQRHNGVAMISRAARGASRPPARPGHVPVYHGCRWWRRRHHHTRPPGRDGHILFRIHRGVTPRLGGRARDRERRRWGSARRRAGVYSPPGRQPACSVLLDLVPLQIDDGASTDATRTGHLDSRVCAATEGHNHSVVLESREREIGA